MKLNLNEQVKVKLTEHGKAVYNKWMEQYPSKYRSELKLDVYGYYHSQLWGIMEMFGNEIGMGCRSVFEGGDIIIGEDL